jgi:bile acid-coenzyme A ligase
MAAIPLGDAIRVHAESKGEARAVTYPDGTLTWRELDRRVTRRARLLRDAGVRRDDLVTLALPNGLAFHEHAFAIWKLGATPNIVSWRLPPHELGAILDLVKPRLAVGLPGDLAGDFARLAGDEDAAGYSDAPFTGEAAAAWKAMSSGGSTGRPKIIVDHEPATIDLAGRTLVTASRMRPGMSVLNPGPLYHNAPFIFSNQALANGCELTGMARFDAREALRLIAAHRVNWVCFVPTMMHRIWALPAEERAQFDVSSLQVVWHMAAPCPEWLKAAWIEWLGPEKIYELYGGTERTGTTLIRGDEWLRKRGSVGRMVGDNEICAFREDGSPCAAGEVGELYFRSKVAPDVRPFHYLGAEEKTRDGGWSTLGDMGHIDEEGYVFLADRRTDLILRGGANIYPAEVEGALDAHPAVASSLVVGLPSEDLGQRVHAIVEPRPGLALDVAALHQFLSARLARYKLPESYELASRPLRDDAGKARRSALRDERAAWLREGRPFRLGPDGAPQ